MERSSLFELPNCPLGEQGRAICEGLARTICHLAAGQAHSRQLQLAGRHPEDLTLIKAEVDSDINDADILLTTLAEDYTQEQGCGAYGNRCPIAAAGQMALRRSA